MFYQILADIVVAIHFAYVSYVVLGELLIAVGIPLGWQWIRNFWFRVSHLLMILIVVAESVVHFECPLTTWEYQLREASGQPIENRSFVGRLLHKLMFFDLGDDSWRMWQWIYGGAAAVVVLTWVLAPPRWLWTSAGEPQIPSRSRGTPQ
jgi:hypothetical protein